MSDAGPAQCQCLLAVRTQCLPLKSAGFSISSHLGYLSSVGVISMTCASLALELSLVGEAAFLTIDTMVCVPRYPDTSHPQLCQELGRLADQCHERLPAAGHPDQGDAQRLGLQTTLVTPAAPCAVKGGDSSLSRGTVRAPGLQRKQAGPKCPEDRGSFLKGQGCLCWRLVLGVAGLTEGVFAGRLLD